MRKWRKVILIVLTAIILAYLARLAYVYVIVIDSCLDRGGRWDYDAETCIGQREE